MTPLADLSESIRGWSEIVAGKAEAVRRFRLAGSGPIVALGWLLVAVLLAAAAQSASAGLPSLGAVLLGLGGQAITVAVLAVVMAQTLHFLKVAIPLNVLFVPVVYALCYMFIVAVPLGLLGPFTGTLAVLAVGFLIFRAARVLAGMRLGLAAAFAVLAIVVLVVVPNALYMLFLDLPSPA